MAIAALSAIRGLLPHTLYFANIRYCYAFIPKLDTLNYSYKITELLIHALYLNTLTL